MKTTVVVGYDRTPAGEQALAEAAREAAERGASLTVLTAYHWPASSPSAPAPAGQADALTAARKAAETIAYHGVGRAGALRPGVPVEAQVVEAHAGKALAEASHAADILVVGHRGEGGFEGMTLGSTALRTLADACCPVIVVRGEPDQGRGRVVAAVDIDGPCEAVLDFAFAEAARRGARLTVVHVWDEPWILAYGQEDPDVADDIAAIERDREDRLAAVVMDVERRYPDVKPFRQVATGPAGRILVEDSKRADLLVTGARRHGDGRHGMQIGPVTQTLVHHAECAVAVVPLN